MKLDATRNLAQALMAGEFPAPQPWEVSEAVAWIGDALTRGDEAITVAHVRKAAECVKKRRLFAEVRALADAWRACRTFDPTLERLRAQALIELSALDEAEACLRDGLRRVSEPGAGAQAQRERLEYEGLRGRVEKQRFVQTGDLDQLTRATDQYLQQYLQPGHPYWHGINAVALAAREQREGLVRRAESVDAMAQAVLDTVASQYLTDADDVWLPATASEACLALGRWDEAELWLYRMLHHPSVDPFAVNAYARQLREIWRGRAASGGPGAGRLAAIITRHQLAAERRWTATPAEFQLAAAPGPERAVLERNFTGELGFSIDAIHAMLAACASVACITNRTGERLGTGFLVDGAWLKASFGEGPVLMTNAHVISDTVPNAIRRDQAYASFELHASTGALPPAYAVDEVLFSSSPDASEPGGGLDVTIARLRGLAGGAAPLPVATNLPVVAPGTHAYVVGHPRGSGLQISLHDSQLLDVDDEDRPVQRVHYRTPTDPGSSGSPVFNGRWKVIALHHSGSSETRRLHGEGTYEANEGIALTAIRRRLNT